MVDYIKSEGYFSIVPEWLIQSPVSAQAVRGYAVLCRYADKDDGTCFPSIKTVGERISASDSTVKRALKELRDIKAIKSEKRFDKATGEQTSNLYTVIRSNPLTEFTYEPPQVKDDTRGSSQETYKLESYNQSHSLEITKEDRKVLWSALTQAFGYSPQTQVERGGWNKCIKQLQEAGATAVEIPNRVEQYKKQFKGMSLTPYALVKHWTLLGQTIEAKPVIYNCNDSGHEFRDSGWSGDYILEICIHCSAEMKS